MAVQHGGYRPRLVIPPYDKCSKQPWHRHGTCQERVPAEGHSKYLARNPRLIWQSKEDIVTRLTLNPGQEQAVLNALASPLTLIQGPPGIYKTS